MARPMPLTNFDAYLGTSRCNWTGAFLEAGTYDQIGLWVTALASSLVVRVGIDADTDGWPWGATAAVLRDAGTIDLSTTLGLRMVNLPTVLVIPTGGAWVWARAQYESGTLGSGTVRTIDGGSGASWPDRPGWPQPSTYNNRGYTGLSGLTPGPGGYNSGPLAPYTAATGRAMSSYSWRPWFRRAA